MALATFSLPDLGEGLQEAEIVEWFATEGDRVLADQPLLSVETDKAIVEVPSPWTGIVLKRRAAVGDVLAIGAPLVDIEEGEVAKKDQGSIVGDLEPAEPASETGSSEAKPALRAAPAVRARARALGVELNNVTGTGPGGVITRADVEAAGKSALSNGTRRSMARAMARSHDNVVPATLTDVADVTIWREQDTDVLTRLVQALVAGVAAEPVLNQWFETDLPQPDGASIAVAVDAPYGLVTPVLHRAEALSPSEIRAGLNTLIEKAQARRLDPESSRGATISLSNFGPIGGRHASLVVTVPQVAILGAGHAYESVGWRDGEAVRSVELPLSLTFDHRAVTGGEAARFLAVVKAHLEQEDP